MNEREKLEALNQSLRDSLSHQLNDGKAQTIAWLKKSLIVGGSALIVYGLAKAFTSPIDSKSSKKKIKKTNNSSQNDDPLYLVEKVKNEAIAWSLSMAAERLEAFLNKIDKEHEEKSSS